jgi:hypothetical protein
MGLSGEDILNIARVCHEANRAYCQTLGDNSQMPWEQAPLWQQDSAIDGVKKALLDPNMKPGDSHVSWSEHKLKDGWKYGPVKDADKKEHPCLVPFDQLPKEQQAKDKLFLAVVRALGH